MARTVVSCLGLGVAAVAAAGGVAGLTGYNSHALVAAASALGGVAGNLATDLCKLLHRPVAARFLEGRSGIAENHRVASALRLAQLAALSAVLDKFDTVWNVDRDRTRRDAAEAFSHKARAFIVTEIQAAEDRFRFNLQIPDDEQALRNTVLTRLPKLLDESLAARREAGDEALVGKGLAELRGIVETTVLEEIWLRTATVPGARPPAFVRLFEGSGAPDSWFDLFVRDAADRLTKEPEFAQVWIAEQAALIRAIVSASAAVLDQRTVRIEATQSEHSKMLQELLDLARSGGVFQRAAEEGISEPAVRAIVERLGGEGIAVSDLVAWLDTWIQAAREQLDRQTNEDEAFEAAWKEAERRFQAGWGNASDALMDELTRERCLEATRREESKNRQIRLLEEAIRFDELELKIVDAVAKLHQMAETEGVSGQEALGTWLSDKAIEFYERGKDSGVNTAIIIAIALFASALKERPRKRVPLDWARTQSNLGAALATLGARESGTARLEEAVSAFYAALEELTRERVPLDWAMAQSNLGSVLTTLGERESETTRLEEAVSAFRAALEELNRERVPLDWAMAQRNLGSVLTTLGGRESSTARLEEAVAALRAALEEWTRERVPLDWAGTQNNLGVALRTLGERESGTARLEEAVSAFHAALEEWTRERVPLDWAGTQNNLGNTLRILGERESGTARLEEAVSAFHAALEEWTRERVPLDWAGTQNNLGNTLRILGERESGTARLEEAVSAFHAALEEWTRERVPLKWAGTQNNLGNTLRTLGERESSTARLEEAVAALRAALEELTRERGPLDWAGTQNNLGVALRTLGERESGTARLEEAVSAFHAALEEWTRERVPLKWAGTQNNLGNTLRILGERESGTARLEEAVSAFHAALEEWTRERAPLKWAGTQNNLGNTLQILGGRESGTARLQEAVSAYLAVLEVRTRERVPLDWAAAQMYLGAVLQALGERESGTVRLEEAVSVWTAGLEIGEAYWPLELTQTIRTTRELLLVEIARRVSK